MHGRQPPQKGQVALVCRERGGAPAHLVLCEQDEPCYQDINDVSQTRVLEKFGNLTSKKQEKRSLKRGPE